MEVISTTEKSSTHNIPFVFESIPEPDRPKPTTSERRRQRGRATEHRTHRTPGLCTYERKFRSLLLARCHFLFKIYFDSMKAKQITFK